MSGHDADAAPATSGGGYAAAREAAYLAVAQERTRDIAGDLSRLLPDGLRFEYAAPTPADVMATMKQLAELPRPKLRELRCHPSVGTWLRLLAPPAEWSGVIGALIGIPVIEKPDMRPGAWELREDGEIVGSGHLGGQP